MELEDIKPFVTTLPEAAGWPEFLELMQRAGVGGRLDWSLPLVACRAVGGDPSLAGPAAAAILCLQISIIFVDDMLDEDPRGEHHRLGTGPTANLALALQSAAIRALGRAEVPPERRAAAVACLAAMAFETARGQHLDVQHPEDEAGYWRVVELKSKPFYGAALEVGAILAGADEGTQEAMRELGLLTGEVVQLHDDLFDAFESPAQPDWAHPRNNLLLLYALTADHTEREGLERLLPQVDDPERLREAQQILFRCGAVSYCAYHLVERHRRAQGLMNAMTLADRGPLLEFLDHQIEPLAHILERAGAKLPNGLRGKSAT